MDETGQEWSHSVQVGPELIWGGPFRSIHGRNRSGVVAGTNLWNREGGDMPPLFETIRGQATNIWGTVNKIPKWGQSQNSEIIEGAAFPWPTLNLLYEWSISVLVMSEMVWSARDRYRLGWSWKGAIEFDPGTVKATQGWCSSILASSELVVIDPSRFEARQRWSNYFWVESELLRSGHDYSR